MDQGGQTQQAVALGGGVVRLKVRGRLSARVRVRARVRVSARVGDDLCGGVRPERPHSITLSLTLTLALSLTLTPTLTLTCAAGSGPSGRMRSTTAAGWRRSSPKEAIRSRANW